MLKGGKPYLFIFVLLPGIGQTYFLTYINIGNKNWPHLMECTKKAIGLEHQWLNTLVPQGRKLFF